MDEPDRFRWSDGSGQGLWRELAMSTVKSGVVRAKFFFQELSRGMDPKCWNGCKKVANNWYSNF